VILSTGTRTDRHFGWTDTGFFFGANMREAVQDYEDALEDLPEVFLGLNWRLYSIQETFRVWGTQPSRIVLTERAERVMSEGDFQSLAAASIISRAKFIVVGRMGRSFHHFAGDLPTGGTLRG
jgi:hypothetical protein